MVSTSLPQLVTYYSDTTASASDTTASAIDTTASSAESSSDHCVRKRKRSGLVGVTWLHADEFSSEPLCIYSTDDTFVDTTCFLPFLFLVVWKYFNKEMFQEKVILFSHYSIYTVKKTIFPCDLSPTFMLLYCRNVEGFFINCWLFMSVCY